MDLSNSPIPHQLITQRTALFYSFNPLNQDTPHILIALHGYGMLAEYFIKHFSEVESPTCVVVPEALSRFYAEGFNGKIGASWMTKYHRDDEIADYIFYLNTLVAKLKALAPNAKLSILGFSQGAATAARWLGQTTVPIHKVLFWAGDIPLDANLANLATLSNKTPFYAVFGEQDPLIPLALAQQKIAELKNNNINITVTTFDGKHEIDKTLLNTLL